MGTLKSVCSSWFALISRDIYEHTHLRVPIFEERKFMIMRTGIKCKKCSTALKAVYTVNNDCISDQIKVMIRSLMNSSFPHYKVKSLELTTLENMDEPIHGSNRQKMSVIYEDTDL